MPKLSQRGAAHLLVPVILLLGIAAAVYLTVTGNLKLFSKASNPPIVFKAWPDGALSNNSSGIPLTTVASIKIEFTSPLGVPAENNVSSPVQRTTNFFRYAENPTDLNNASFMSYTSEPMVIGYTFRDRTPGEKFIWAEFKGTNAGSTVVQRVSARIELAASAQQACTVCSADIKKDGGVNGIDMSYLTPCKDKSVSENGTNGRSCSDKDTNGDGKINQLDIDCIKSFMWQEARNCPTNPAQESNTFTNLSADTPLNGPAVFNFTYNGTSSKYYINVSTSQNMTTDIYWNFANGASSPVTLNNPSSKWAKYSCGKTLYWQVVTQSNVKSPIQSFTVNCANR